MSPSPNIGGRVPPCPIGIDAPAYMSWRRVASGPGGLCELRVRWMLVGSCLHGCQVRVVQHAKQSASRCSRTHARAPCCRRDVIVWRHRAAAAAAAAASLTARGYIKGKKTTSTTCVN